MVFVSADVGASALPGNNPRDVDPILKPIGTTKWAVSGTSYPANINC